MEGLFWGKSLGDFELQDKSKLQDPSSNLTPVVGVLCCWKASDVGAGIERAFKSSSS